MGEAIIVALITGTISLVGMIITFKTNTDLQRHEIDKKMAVIDERINKLTDEVKVHNNYAIRMPVVEQKIKALESRMNSVEAKLDKNKIN